MRKEVQEMQNRTGGSANTNSLEERLGKLQQLRDKDLITEEDFAKRKEQILSEI